MTPRSAAPTSEDVAEFVRLVLGHTPSVGAAFIETMRARGTSLDAVFLQLFAPAARYLGELWQSDIYDFTRGHDRPSHAAHLPTGAVARIRAGMPTGGQRTRTALLATSPADQHTFGLAILREFVQRAGWNVMTEYPNTAEQLVNMARSAPYHVIGMSASCDVSIESFATLIQNHSKSSAQPRPPHHGRRSVTSFSIQMLLHASVRIPRPRMDDGP